MHIFVSIFLDWESRKFIFSALTYLDDLILVACKKHAHIHLKIQQIIQKGHHTMNTVKSNTKSIAKETVKSPIQYETVGSNIILKHAECLSLDLTLDCGQAFRWKKSENGKWNAAVMGKYIELKQETDSDNPSIDTLIFYNTSEDDFKNIWIPYFDLERDYADICTRISDDESIKKAVEEFYGIRILNQEPWEALCSFIISQNNNIPRIKGIIERLCKSFGDPISQNGETVAYSFPTAQRIAALEPEELAPLRAGFRNKYIIDAARKVAFGEVDLEKIKTLPLCEAEAELIKIKGVGSKVAQCTLLYGCNHIDAFPVDVWVKRIMSEMYPNGLPKCTDGVRGIAQQYLFHWRRNSSLFENE